MASYESLNPYEADAQPGFYVALAADVGAKLVVDLGCGTGLVSRELAERGHQVIGVEPSAPMLEVARAGRFGDRVEWVHGGATSLGSPVADLAVMSGHVAQFFLDDQEWMEGLRALRDALRAGGRLAFESRDPHARAWESWTPRNRSVVVSPVAGRIETWCEVDAVGDGIVSCTNHYVFVDKGEELLSPVRLRFRDERELRASLEMAGFAVEDVYGDWDRRPTSEVTTELIFVASR